MLYKLNERQHGSRCIQTVMSGVRFIDEARESGDDQCNATHHHNDNNDDDDDDDNGRGVADCTPMMFDVR